jgi:hypothetical protein
MKLVTYSRTSCKVIVAQPKGELQIVVHRTWKPAEEKALIEQFKQSVSDPTVVPQLAKRFNRSPEAIQQKLRRLGVYGLNVVGSRAAVTTTFEATKDLLSPEEVLKTVAAALKKATEPGLGKTELQRLGTIVALSKEYREGLREFVNYQQIDAKLVELEKKYGELAKEKSKDPASKRDTANVVQATAQ